MYRGITSLLILLNTTFIYSQSFSKVGEINYHARINYQLLKDTCLYVLDSKDALHVYSITKPESPVRLYSKNTAAVGGATGVDIKGKNLYVVSQSGGLQIYEALSKEITHRSQLLIGSGAPTEIAVYDSLAFSVGVLGARIFNISVSSTPFIVDSLDCGMGWNIDIYGNSLYMFLNKGIFVYPIQPRFADSPSDSIVIPSGKPYKYNDSLLFVCNGKVHLLNISNSSHPKKIITLKGINNAVDIGVRNDTAFIANESASISMFDVSDINNVVPIGQMGNVWRSAGVLVISACVYVFSAEGKIYIYSRNLANYIRLPNSHIKRMLSSEKQNFYNLNGRIFRTNSSHKCNIISVSNKGKKLFRMKE